LLRHVSQVLSKPLPRDVELFKEMDGILEEVQPSYSKMERLWADEVDRLTKALKDRRLDPRDIDH
jgi:hypothetical protein